MKSVLRWVFIFSITLIIIGSYGLLRIKKETRQLSGENTPVVDPSGFETISGKIAIIKVNVLSPNSEKMMPNQTVLINENIIESVTDENQIPNDYRIINAEGKYLIPGLVDTHIHPYKSKNDLLLFIANGITHVAMMSSWEGTRERE